MPPSGEETPPEMMAVPAAPSAPESTVPISGSTEPPAPEPPPQASPQRRGGGGRRIFAIVAIVIVAIIGIALVRWWPVRHPAANDVATQSEPVQDTPAVKDTPTAQDAPAPATPAPETPAPETPAPAPAAQAPSPPTVPPAPAPPAATVPSQPAAAGPTNSELAARLDRLDEAVGGLQENGAASLKPDLDALDQRVTELGRKLDGAIQQQSAGPQQLSALSDMVKQLSDRLNEVNTTVQRQDDAKQEEAVRVLAAAEIATAVASSLPYAPALQTLQRLGDDAATAGPVSALAIYAQQDTPSRAKLEWQLTQMPRQMDQPVTGDDDGGFWHRALARIESLVQIRRTADATDGKSSPASVVAAAETELAGGDLGAAIHSIEALQGHAAAVAAPWLEQARARLQIEQVSQALQAAVVAKLAPGTGTER